MWRFGSKSENKKGTQAALRFLFFIALAGCPLMQQLRAQFEDLGGYADEELMLEEAEPGRTGRPEDDAPLRQDFNTVLLQPSYYGQGSSRATLASTLVGPSSPGIRSGEGNFMLGPVSAQITAGFGMEYNSNVTLSSDPVADIALVPSIGLNFIWPITQFNVLSATIGFDYSAYLINPDLSSGGPTIEPGSQLEFRARAGDFTFTIYEAPSVSRSTTENPGLADTVRFGQFQNVAGISVQWNLNRLLFTLGYERGDFFSITDTFDQLNGNSNSVVGGALYELTPTVTVGVRGSISSTTYTGDSLNNNVNTLFAGLFEARLSTSTSVLLEAGLQTFTFSDTGSEIDELDTQSRQTNIDGTLGGGDVTSPYLQIGVANVINRYFTHALNAGYLTAAGSVSDFTSGYYVNYALAWRTNRWLTTAVGVSYSHGTVSGEGGGTYNEIEPVIEASLDVFKNWSLTLRYSIAAEDSNYGQSYFQQRIFVGTKYQF